jgi:hypothetical protein
MDVELTSDELNYVMHPPFYAISAILREEARGGPLVQQGGYRAKPVDS